MPDHGSPCDFSQGEKCVNAITFLSVTFCQLLNQLVDFMKFSREVMPLTMPSSP
jgi:hypothetical protein